MIKPLLFVILLSWVAFVIVGNWPHLEDRYYEKKLMSEPHKHSRCFICKRVRPHKQMTYHRGYNSNVCFPNCKGEK